MEDESRQMPIKNADDNEDGCEATNHEEGEQSVGPTFCDPDTISSESGRSTPVGQLRLPPPLTDAEANRWRANKRSSFRRYSTIQRFADLKLDIVNEIQRSNRREGGPSKGNNNNINFIDEVEDASLNNELNQGDEDSDDDIVRMRAENPDYEFVEAAEANDDDNNEIEA